MKPPLDDVCGASFPLAALAALADLRRSADVRVIAAAERTWLRWRAGDEAVLRRVHALPGVQLYVRRDGFWYRLGSYLPAFGVPLDHEGQPLHQALVPDGARVQIASAWQARPERLRLVRDDRPRTTTGLLADLADLGLWVELATTAQLQALQAARTDGLVMVRGSSLPLLARGERFWGERVLIPLGWHAEPALPESALRTAMKLAEEEILVWRTGGAEVIPGSAFQPLTRAGVRLALQGRAARSV